MKKTINSLEKGLISALLILTFSCSRELDSPPPGGLMSASNTISEYEMLNTSRIWFEENYQSPCYVVSWANAKVHTSDTAYCAEARITGTFGMKYLSPEKTGLDADMPHLVVKSVENERQARIMYISPDAGNTQDVRLMNYSNVGIFTGKIYYFDPDEKLSHIILFHNGQADTYFAPVASGNASGGELLMDDEITEDEYNDLPDDIKTLYWYDRKSGKYTLNHFDEVNIYPKSSGGDDSGKKTNLEEYPRPKDDAFPRKDGGGSSGGGGNQGNIPDSKIPKIEITPNMPKRIQKGIERANEAIDKVISDCIPEEFSEEVQEAIENGKFDVEYIDRPKSEDGNNIQMTRDKADDGSFTYTLQIYKGFIKRSGVETGIPTGIAHEMCHLILFLNNISSLAHHETMINFGLMEKVLRKLFPNRSDDFYFFAKFSGSYDSKAFDFYRNNMDYFYIGYGILL